MIISLSLKIILKSILIPNLNFAESKIEENEVYNTPDVKDNYGKDLLIIDKDFSIVSPKAAFHELFYSQNYISCPDCCKNIEKQ